MPAITAGEIVAAAKFVGRAATAVGEKLSAEIFGDGVKAGAARLADSAAGKLAQAGDGLAIGSGNLAGRIGHGTGFLDAAKTGLPNLSIEASETSIASLEARLGAMNKQAPMAKLIGEALNSGDKGVIESLHSFYSQPIGARSLLSTADAHNMTNMLKAGTPEGLAAVRSELGAVVDIGRTVKPDPTAAEIFAKLNKSGEVVGTDPWFGRLAKPRQ